MAAAPGSYRAREARILSAYGPAIQGTDRIRVARAPDENTIRVVHGAETAPRAWYRSIASGCDWPARSWWRRRGSSSRWTHRLLPKSRRSEPMWCRSGSALLTAAASGCPTAAECFAGWFVGVSTDAEPGQLGAGRGGTVSVCGWPPGHGPGVGGAFERFVRSPCSLDAASLDRGVTAIAAAVRWFDPVAVDWSSRNRRHRP